MCGVYIITTKNILSNLVNGASEPTVVQANPRDYITSYFFDNELFAVSITRVSIKMATSFGGFIPQVCLGYHVSSSRATHWKGCKNQDQFRNIN
jgi:hypothetical protein